jgi:hypothetical protein
MWKIGRVESFRLTPEDCCAMREHGVFVKAKGIIKMLRRLHPGVMVQPEQVQKMLWEQYQILKLVDRFAEPPPTAAERFDILYE